MMIKAVLGRQTSSVLQMVAKRTAEAQTGVPVQGAPGVDPVLVRAPGVAALAVDLRVGAVAGAEVRVARAPGAGAEVSHAPGVGAEAVPEVAPEAEARVGAGVKLRMSAKMVIPGKTEDRGRRRS